ncbi:hypothetical protein PIROE2DRAFT_9283 [Piromyces sp. E2]|nr:hypothetical protein PIROE2DRAFT_9283 [Piromyces sp. E2]|eukprot:OUM64052.1 hypothetical protein PIROE2DRAFT_9283 [Piromyces sp. E2]
MMTKKEVLDIDVYQYSHLDIEKCPDYSVGYEHSSERFDVCKPNNVVFDDCQSKHCSSDNECLSNKYFEGKCITNEEYPVIKCMDIYYYDYTHIRDSAKMHCGYTDGEKCKVNSDCASNECIDGICETHYQEHKYNFLIALAIIVLICIIILISIVFIFILLCKKLPLKIHKKQLERNQGRIIDVKQIDNGSIIIEEIKSEFIEKSLLEKRLSSNIINYDIDI